MLNCALEFKEVFPRFQQKDNSYKFCPSQEDWHKLEEVCSFLEVFNQATELISGSKYPTSNLFLSELWGIKEMLDDKFLNGEPFIREMAKKMKEKFDKYWGSCNILISIGAALDPRNKMNLINFAFNSMYTEELAEMYIEDIKKTLYELYKEYVADYKASNVDKPSLEGESSGGTTNLSASSLKGKAIYGKRKYETYIRTDYTINRAKSELDLYLDEGVVIEDENENTLFNCLEWWKTNSSKYCILSRMTCDILSIPITSVASEATCSAGGRVIDQYRASLGTDTVQYLLCGSDWYHNYYGIKRKLKNKDEVKEINLTEEIFNVFGP